MVRPWAVMVLEKGRWRARGWKCWRCPIFEHMFIYRSAGSVFFIRRLARFPGGRDVGLGRALIYNGEDRAERRGLISLWRTVWRKRR